MVFIDGDHCYDGVKRDIEWALRMGVPVISGYDYDKESPRCHPRRGRASWKIHRDLRKGLVLRPEVGPWGKRVNHAGPDDRGRFFRTMNVLL
jgi:hypothetical protein